MVFSSIGKHSAELTGHSFTRHYQILPEFPDELMSSTFSIASTGNGLMAIVAGVIAQVAADALGDIGPFQLAIALTLVTLVLIVLFWTENRGGDDDVIAVSSPKKKRSSSPAPGSAKEESIGDIVKQIKHAYSVIKKSPAMICLGLSQACFEGGVYTFVFMWVPTMLRLCALKGTFLPTGLVFSSFMLSMSIGGMLAPLLLQHVFRGSAMLLCVAIYLTSAASMAVPIVAFEDFWAVFIAFLVLEAMVGMFNSEGGVLRSQFYPGELQASIMSVFRVPLNVLVVTGTKLTGWAGDDIDLLKKVFGVVVGMHLVSAALQLAMRALCSPTGASGGSPKRGRSRSPAARDLEETKKPNGSRQAVSSSTAKPAASPRKRGGRSRSPAPMKKAR